MSKRFTWGTPRYTTLVQNGLPANRLDVAIMGDGYAADDMHLFYEDVDAIIAEFHAVEPMASYIQHFNFHRVDVVSHQSGINDRWQKPPVKVKSALGTHFSFIAERRLVGPDPWVWHVANQSGVPWDSVLVVCNTPRRGGATLFTMGVGYASRNSSDFPRIMIHEAGHSIAKLMDEYTGELPDMPFFEGRSLPNLLPFANITTNGKNPKWKVWVEEETACPTPGADRCTPATVGAFEGAGYTNFGVYRPTVDCIMKRHYAQFCPVCREQWIKRIYRKSTIADAFSPQENGLHVPHGATMRFEANVIRPKYIHTTWRIKQKAQRGWTTAQQTIDYEPFALHLPEAAHGRTHWQIECALEDHHPWLRKPDVIKATRQTHSWRIVAEL
jgi:hypothetical protein